MSQETLNGDNGEVEKRIFTNADLLADPHGVITVLYQQHFTEFVRYARFILGRNSDTEDVVNNAFVGLMEKVEVNDSSETPLDPLKDPYYYLKSAIHNRAIMHGKRRSTQDLSIEIPAIATGRIGIKMFPTQPDNPETVAFSNLGMSVIERAVKELPGQQREVFVRRRMLGDSAAEVSVALGINGSQKSHLSRADNRLRSRLKP